MLLRLKLRVLRDADGVPGGPPAEPAADPQANTPEPAAAAEPEPEPTTVPLKALTETQRKLREAREEIAFFKGMQAAAPTAQAPQHQAPAAPATPVEPRLEDFESFEAFQQADRQYVIDVATHNARTQFEQQQSQQQRQQSQQQQVQTFNARLAKAAELDPDLPAIASTFHLPGPNHLPLTGAMQDAIIESEVGPQLLRYFANNRDKVAQLATLSPSAALRQIGQIEASIINKPAPPVKHVTSAPEPVKPIGSGGAVEVDEDKLPMNEYMARERQKKDAARAGAQRR